MESNDPINDVPDKDTSTETTLEKFITDEYSKQKEQGKLSETEDIDEERATKFFTRALAESQRMSAETSKSHQKMTKLHADLGAETFTSWRQEHAAEVLLPEERAAVELHSTNIPST